MRKIRILLTSPAGYAGRLIKAFEELDGGTLFHPVSMPLIHTDVNIESDGFMSFINHLDDYDYIAFSSRKSIEAFALGLRQAGVTLPSRAGLCAIGMDNELLRGLLHAEPAFISAEPSPMGIVNHLHNLPVSGKRIAVLAPRVIGMEEPPIVPDFIHGLEQIGMLPERITAYETGAASESEQHVVARQIEQNEYDAVVFTSGTEIKVFRQMAESHTGVVTENLKVICYGPYTARCAAEYGVKVDFTSPSFGSFQEFVAEICNFYNLSGTAGVVK